MSLTRALRAMLASCLLATGSLPAFATITFDGAPGGNTDAFTTFTEAGFDVTVVEGTWLKSTIGPIGNPAPSAIGAGVTTGLLEIKHSIAGTVFNFLSVDIIDGLSGADKVTFEVEGLLAGIQQFADTGSIPATQTYHTVADGNSGIAVDQLRLRVSSTQNNLGSFGVDNIRVTGPGVPQNVPAPATAMLLALGLIGAGVRRPGV